MPKLIIRDLSESGGGLFSFGGKERVFEDTREGYRQAIQVRDELRAAGHKLDLSANNTGRRLVEFESSTSSFFGSLFG